jgi:serine-type D-Ala-D-Ala carboxypeptidase/endopeptidase (penicillin-binding protein 4)
VINATPDGPARSRRRLVRCLATTAVLAVVGAGAWRASVSDSAPGTGSTDASAASAAGAPRATAVLAATGPAGSPPSPAALAAVLDTILHTRTIGGQAAAAVADAATGRVLYSGSLSGQGAAEPMPPASTTKIATSISLLEHIPATARLPTKVVAEPGGDQIVLVGGGDVTLSSTGSSPDPDFHPAKLGDLVDRTAAALKAQGRTTVSLGYDASVFTGPSCPPAWSPSFITGGNVAPVVGLQVDEGRLDPVLEFSARYPDPARTAATMFAQRLTAQGITVVGPPQPTTAEADARQLAEVQSPPVGQLVEHTLTVSDDDLAEALAHLAARAAGRPADFDGASQTAMAALSSLGMDTAGTQLFDGSGLSHQDRITPADLVAMLAAATSSAHPELRPILSGLPIAGFSGTLGGRFTAPGSTQAVGLVRAKTGTLDGVNTEAGTLVDADGRLLVFSVMAADAADATASRNQLDRFAAALLACGCH